MPSERVEKLANRLLGSCDSAVDEIEELTIEECRELDDIVLLCSGCGWWFEASEVDEELCNECRDAG